jgi:hypothetical protein
MLYPFYIYSNKYFDSIKNCITKSQSIVDFGTAMINKHKSKKNKRRK